MNGEQAWEAGPGMTSPLVPPHPARRARVVEYAEREAQRLYGEIDTLSVEGTDPRRECFVAGAEFAARQSSPLQPPSADAEKAARGMEHWARAASNPAIRVDCHHAARVIRARAVQSPTEPSNEVRDDAYRVWRDAEFEPTVSDAFDAGWDAAVRSLPGLPTEPVGETPHGAMRENPHPGLPNQNKEQK